MKIAISTDTSSTINLDLAKKLGIKVFPLNVIVNGEEFLDGISIDQNKLEEDMRAGKVIKTSTPPPMDVISYFEKLFNEEGYDHVIHFTISSKLSSMNTLFNNLTNEHFAGKVTVVDSYSLSMAMLSHVLFAYEEVQKETPIETIVNLLEERKNKTKLCFVPENLTALKNGGRISPAVAALGNMIGLKPVLVLEDGALDKDSMTRNVKKTLGDNIASYIDAYPIESYDYTVVSFNGNEELVNHIIKDINKHSPDYNVHVQPVAINVCAHCGPGTVGVVVSPKINEHSINYYFDLV